MTDKTYTIVKSERTPQQETKTTLMACGLGWGEASNLRDIYTAAEIKTHPQKTCWSRAVYIIRMEAEKNG